MHAAGLHTHHNRILIQASHAEGREGGGGGERGAQWITCISCNLRLLAAWRAAVMLYCCGSAEHWRM